MNFYLKHISLNNLKAAILIAAFFVACKPNHTADELKSLNEQKDSLSVEVATDVKLVYTDSGILRAKIFASFLIKTSPSFCLINSPTRNCLWEYAGAIFPLPILNLPIYFFWMVCFYYVFFFKVYKIFKTYSTLKAVLNFFNSIFFPKNTRDFSIINNNPVSY